MPNIKSAKKALRQSAHRRAFNVRRKNMISMVTKQLQKLAAAGKQAEAAALLPHAYKSLDKATKTGVLKQNTVARKKSMLARLVTIPQK